ncbi:MAG TPA: sugar porter family MFS transporter [Clostridia bacterium]|nr:sugar porter family MFS transporter [Clostridia bacterium]
MTNSAIDTRYVTMVASGAALGGFLFGFDTSTMNAAITGIRSTLELSSAQVGLVAAISLIGAAIGAWFAGPVAARFGRNRVMFIAGALITLGALAFSLTSQMVLLGLFRLMVGLGIGSASAVVPAYIVEISPPAIRGRLGSLWQFAIVIGQLLGLLAGYGLTRWAGSEAAPLFFGAAAWRWMFAVVALLAAGYVFISRLLPQTPEDLIRYGHENDARALLSRIGGVTVEEEIASISEELGKESRVATLKDLRGSKFGLKALVWVGILLAVFQQLVGINVVKTYSNALWRLVGFSTGASFTISIITVLVSIASTMVAIVIIDMVGRRAMLLSGAGMMAMALGTLAVCFCTATGSGDDIVLTRRAAITALIAINVFSVAFGVTWGPVMWVMLGELFAGNLRTVAVAVCTAANWITNWAVTRTFPLLAGIGLGFVYGLYSAFAVLAFVFVLKALPETKGRAIT